MKALQIALMVVFVLDTVLLVLAVLIQSGRGGGLAGALGGLGGESALGTHTTSTIAKITWVLGGVFMAACVLLAWMGSSARAKTDFPAGGGPPAAPTQPMEPADVPTPDEVPE